MLLRITDQVGSALINAVDPTHMIFSRKIAACLRPSILSFDRQALVGGVEGWDEGGGEGGVLRQLREGQQLRVDALPVVVEDQLAQL